MMSVMIINNFAMLEIHNLHLNSILKVLQTIIKIQVSIHELNTQLCQNKKMKKKIYIYTLYTHTQSTITHDVQACDTREGSGV